MAPPVLVSRGADVAQVRDAAGLLHDPGVDRPMPERPIGDLEAEPVRKSLRSVSYTACSRHIVATGLVGEIVTKRQAVEIEFKPNTRDGARSPTWSETSEKGVCGPGLVFRGCFSMS